VGGGKERDSLIDRVCATTIMYYGTAIHTPILCVYMYIYVYMKTMRIFVYLNIYKYIHIYICMYEYIQIYTH
jgi:hypothetical protein